MVDSEGELITDVGDQMGWLFAEIGKIFAGTSEEFSDLAEELGVIGHDGDYTSLFGSFRPQFVENNKGTVTNPWTDGSENNMLNCLAPYVPDGSNKKKVSEHDISGMITV